MIDYKHHTRGEAAVKSVTITVAEGECSHTAAMAQRVELLPVSVTAEVHLDNPAEAGNWVRTVCGDAEIAAYQQQRAEQGLEPDPTAYRDWHIARPIGVGGAAPRATRARHPADHGCFDEACPQCGPSVLASQGLCCATPSMCDCAVRAAKAAETEHLRASVMLAQADAENHAVDMVVRRLKAKLAAKRAQGFGGGFDPDQCSQEMLATMLMEHVLKGDPTDVALIAIMLAYRGQSTVVGDKGAY